MIDERLIDYLGVDVSALLRTPPFSGWRVTRSVEQEPGIETQVWYEFEGRGVEVICDGSDRIRTIFLHRGDGEAFSELPFSSSRRDVLERYGAPSKSGGPTRIPALGEMGAWDRFTLAASTLHVQYRLDRDEIDMITHMRPDAVP